MSIKAIELNSTKSRLIAIFITAFLIRLAMNAIFQGLNSPQDPGFPDQMIYATGAENIVHGKGFAFGGMPSTYTPGPAFVLATIYSFFGINYAAARIGFSLLGALTVVILYFIGKELQGETLGLVASLALALYPTNFYQSSHFFAEVPFGFFISLAILNAILLQKYQKIRYGIFLGIAVALSAYMKPSAIIYLPQGIDRTGKEKIGAAQLFGRNLTGAIIPLSQLGKPKGIDIKPDRTTNMSKSYCHR